MPRLVVFNSNWQGEMDVQGYSLMSESEWAEYHSTIEKLPSLFEICIGTNEQIEFQSAAEFSNSLSVKNITMDEHNFLLDSLGRTFGHFPDIDELNDIIDDYEDEYDEEYEEDEF